MNGMRKLRISIGFLFVCYVIVFVLSFFANSIAYTVEQDWYNSLPKAEQDDYKRYKDNMPNPYTESYYGTATVFNWVLGISLFILFLKVFYANDITEKERTESYYAVCDNCGTEFDFKKNANKRTRIKCPKCGKREKI